MQNGGVVELVREAAAAVRAEQLMAVAAPVPPAAARKFRGVQRRGRRYAATFWNPYVKKAVWLGSYETPVEAAHAYDAAARSVLGRWARPNFPDPSSAPAPAAGQVSEPAHQQAVPQPQASFVHLAPALPEAAAAQQQQQRAAAPPILRLFYRPGIGLFAVPFVPPGAYYVPGLNNVPVPNRPVSVALSTSAPVDGASQSGSVAADEPDEGREMPVSPATAAVEPVVGDNFTDIDGASSSVARAYVP